MVKKFIVRKIVRLKFFLTSRKAADRVIESSKERYDKLVKSFGLLAGLQDEVPEMIGVDPEMRKWSLYMILEHNTIVNRAICETVAHLVDGEQRTKYSQIDPKLDVLPGPNPGEQEVGDFFRSIQLYQQRVASMDRLRGSAKSVHPVFGDFDAHQWHCMFGFHLNIHLKQAEVLLGQLESLQSQ